MTLKDYITILSKAVGEVKISTSPTEALNSLTIEDKIVSFDSKIIVSHVSMSTVKYGPGDDDVTIISSIEKVPKSCKWVGIFKVALNEENDNNIEVHLNIISIGKEVDINNILEDELKTFIKI